MDVLAVEGRDRLGEGPCWLASEGRLLWVDILGRRVRRARLDGDEQPAIDTPADVGFAVPDDDGGLLAGLRTGLGRWTPTEGWRTWSAADWEPARMRVNDGKVDASGRLWFGTMHDEETEPVAALYRVEDDGPVRVVEGATTSNGLGWSPDGSVMYWADSPTHRIFAFGVDADGALHDRRVFAEDPATYLPDGLCVDDEGCVWSAKWDGGRVVRYAPDGRVDREVVMPVSRPTSVAFVGDRLDTVAVTSARADDRPSEELAGAVFLLDAGVTGGAATTARRPAGS